MSRPIPLAQLLTQLRSIFFSLLIFLTILLLLFIFVVVVVFVGGGASVLAKSYQLPNW